MKGEHELDMRSENEVWLYIFARYQSRPSAFGLGLGPNSQAPSASISMYHVSGHLPYMYVFCLMNKSVKEG